MSRKKKVSMMLSKLYGGRGWFLKDIENNLAHKFLTKKKQNIKQTKIQKKKKENHQITIHLNGNRLRVQKSKQNRQQVRPNFPKTSGK
jgi:hypothetical protein